MTPTHTLTMSDYERLARLRDLSREIETAEWVRARLESQRTWRRWLPSHHRALSDARCRVVAASAAAREIVRAAR